MPARRSRGVLVRRLAPITLMPAAALAVHELRYLLAFGRYASVELERQGHAYLQSLVPWVVLLLAVAAGIFINAMADSYGGESSLPRYTASFSVLWAMCAACLLCIYVCQEFLEGWLATGHAAGLAGIFGYGGWWAIPAALAVGMVLAALLHGAREVLEVMASRSRPGGTRAAGALGSRRPESPLLPRLLPLVDGWSGRGPPA